MVNITLGNSIDGTSIVAGDDVYLSCNVNSNPVLEEIKWFKEVNYNCIIIFIFYFLFTFRTENFFRKIMF